ncbi:hypothetical protein L3X39_06065 [Sabulilitoribacter multivorans]|uniref:Ankyrin repeat domain-containing protein n=1 Tax=Flaviramulus multivorans TaxID=1304750 RepID=A0ABS9III3_9FLAO|nr:hypothetical protein [Flaviramulus multivorans]MCF7560198.1 hypothetical protein [Flaviramulus multivorans]
MNKHSISRRALVKSSVFGILAVSIPSITYAKSIYDFNNTNNAKDNLSNRYPAIDDAIVNEVVGKSHFDLDRVKELVDKRPELSRATWDWGFGDWESAIGAASHVGRRDIIAYLLSKGAKANIFTFATLGAYDTVKSMIEFYPGIQENYGPHGISLLQHATVGLRMKDKMTADQITNSEKLISYLEQLGNADGATFEELTEGKEKYLGDYKYGEGDNEGFSVKQNMRDMLTFGSLGNFGGALYKVKDHEFRYNKFPSVFISFQVENEQVISVTVKEPDLTLVAKKV